MISREELLKRLHDSPMYRAALDMLKSDVERKQLDEATSTFLMNCVDSLAPAVTKALSAEHAEASSSQQKLVSERTGTTSHDGDL